MLEKYLQWKSISQVMDYSKRAFCLGIDCKDPVSGISAGVSPYDCMPVVMAEEIFKATVSTASSGELVLVPYNGNDAKNIFESGIGKVWEYYLQECMGEPEALIENIKDWSAVHQIGHLAFEEINVLKNRKFVFNHLRKSPDVFKADFCRNLYINCLFFTEQSKESGLEEDEREFRKLKKSSFLRPDGNFTCTLHAVCKQLEEDNINKLYLLDKAIGYSVAFEAASYSNANYPIYRLMQDGQRLLVDKIAKIEYPYIRKRMYDTLMNMLSSALVDEKDGIKKIAEFYDLLQSIDIVGINTELSRIMYPFYDYIIQGAYMSGAVQSLDGDELVQAVRNALKMECFKSKERELNDYIKKNDVRELENRNDEKCNKYFQEIARGICKQMSNGK